MSNAKPDPIMAITIHYDAAQRLAVMLYNYRSLNLEATDWNVERVRNVVAEIFGDFMILDGGRLGPDPAKLYDQPIERNGFRAESYMSLVYQITSTLLQSVANLLEPEFRASVEEDDGETLWKALLKLSCENFAETLQAFVIHGDGDTGPLARDDFSYIEVALGQERTKLYALLEPQIPADKNREKRGSIPRETAPDGPQYLATKITGLSYRLIDYLWFRGSASFEDLLDDAWTKNVQDSAITKAIERANGQLLKRGEPITLVVKNGNVAIDRPGGPPEDLPDK